MSDYVYDLMKKHHSVRQFKDKALSDETVQKLVEEGRAHQRLVTYKHIQL